MRPAHGGTRAASQVAAMSIRAARSRSYGAARAGLIAANLALVWALPVLPGQDLPQHLAYARIFLDWNRPELPFFQRYLLPSHFEPYFTVYLLLVVLDHLISLERA